MKTNNKDLTEKLLEELKKRLLEKEKRLLKKVELFQSQVCLTLSRIKYDGVMSTGKNVHHAF